MKIITNQDFILGIWVSVRTYFSKNGNGYDYRRVMFIGLGTIHLMFRLGIYRTVTLQENYDERVKDLGKKIEFYSKLLKCHVEQPIPVKET